MRTGWWTIVGLAVALGLGACEVDDREDDDAPDDDAADDDASDDDAADDDAAPGTAPVISSFEVGIEGADPGRLRAYFEWIDADGDVSQGKARIWADGENVFVFPIEFETGNGGAMEMQLPVDDPGWHYEAATLYLWHATLQDYAGNLSNELTYEAATP